MSEMREILFRGKRKDNGKWVEGYYARKGVDKDTFKHFICVMTFNVNGNTYSSMFYLTDIEVIPETVGQYTGLTDKSGLTKVFEGDIIRYVEIDVDGSESTHISVFYYDAEKATWAIKNGEYRALFSNLLLENIEVIGNIYDNPELMENSK